MPVAVVGPPTVAAQLNDLPGDPLDARQASSRSDALSQVDDRDVYGAYEAATNHLFVASAANRATAVALEATFNRAAAAQGGAAVRVTDVKPLSPNDPNGTAVFYAAIAWVFGGYIASRLIGLIGSPRSSSRQRAAARLGALAGFSIVAGILSVVILRTSFDVFSCHVVALCAIAAATIFASGAATAGIQAALGPAGTGLVILRSRAEEAGGTAHPMRRYRGSRRPDTAWRRAGLRRITLHECRHSFASMMIDAGVNPKALSTYMGHANISITLDRYGHLMPGNEEEAAQRFYAYLTAQQHQADRRARRQSPAPAMRPDRAPLATWLAHLMAHAQSQSQRRPATSRFSG